MPSISNEAVPNISAQPPVRKRHVDKATISSAPSREDVQDTPHHVEDTRLERAIRHNEALGFVCSTPAMRRRPSYIREWDGTAAYVGSKTWLKWLIVASLALQLLALPIAVVKEIRDRRNAADKTALKEIHDGPLGATVFVAGYPVLMAVAVGRFLHFSHRGGGLTRKALFC